MTPTARSPETTERKKAAATGTEDQNRGASGGNDERRQSAVAALMHRVSGGLNNAAMAFELGLAPAAGAEQAASQRVMLAGLAGVGQAARAATLLGELLLPGTTNGGAEARLRDVIDVLRARAAGRTVALRIEGELPQGADGPTTAALAVASLLDGLAALERAEPGDVIVLAIAETRGGACLRRAAATKAPGA